MKSNIRLLSLIFPLVARVNFSSLSMKFDKEKELHQPAFKILQNDTLPENMYDMIILPLKFV